MLGYVFVLMVVAMRFMPHPWGFAPVAAALLYFGARGARRQLWIPLALFVATDLAITKAVYAYPVTWDHFVTWAWYAAVLWLGTGLSANAGLRKASDWLRVGGASLASSVVFFIVSNFAVWACWSMYPKTFAGLTACYVAGIPFFRTGLEGNLIFTLVMFGLPAAAARFARSEKADPVVTA